MADGLKPLVPRPAACSLEDLLAGAADRELLDSPDAKSGAALERLTVDGRRLVLKHLHPDGDWTMRGFGDIGCLPVRVWTTGLLDALPACIDHATCAVVERLGRNGWGGAVLMRDVTASLVPSGDEPISMELHRQLLDGLAALAAAFWDRDDLPELLPLENRWTAFGPGWLAAERELGWPEAVPPIADGGWERFTERAPADVVDLVATLRSDPGPLVAAARRTPQTFIHGDWKLGNLGVAEGRTILLDWTYAGVGPVAYDLGWYLAVNRARLPESKDDSIEALRASLERHGIATGGWWEAQLGICLLGTLVQFGWEKALGDEDELTWWCDRAREGEQWLV